MTETEQPPPPIPEKDFDTTYQNFQSRPMSEKDIDSNYQKFQPQLALFAEKEKNQEQTIPVATNQDNKENLISSTSNQKLSEESSNNSNNSKEDDDKQSSAPTSPSPPLNVEAPLEKTHEHTDFVKETTKLSEENIKDAELEQREGDDEQLIDCPCQHIDVSPGSATCNKCDQIIPSLASLYKERLQYLDDLDIATSKIKEEIYKSEMKDDDIKALKDKIVELEDQIDTKTDALNDLQRAMAVLNEKYVDEIDKVAELQHSKDMVEGELEELSRSLFEQANGMVISEKKLRHESDVQRKLLENQLQETRERLAAESSQLQELRERMEQMQQQQPEPNSKRSSGQSDPSFRASIDLAELFGLRERAPEVAAVLPPPTGEDGIGVDEECLSEFKDFVIQSPSVKIQKIHTIPFMKHCLEEDVDPCMRFGNNPRVSHRRIVDAIIANTCCIEEAPPGADKEWAMNPNSPIRNSAAKPMLWERFSSNPNPFPRAVCQCCGRQGPLPFQFRITTLDDWLLIDRYCRDRLVAVCEFYVFIRNIRQGLYNNRKLEDLYSECLRLRLQMFYARLGALPSVLNTLGIKGTELASARKPSLPNYEELNEKTAEIVEDGALTNKTTNNEYNNGHVTLEMMPNGNNTPPINGGSVSPIDSDLPPSVIPPTTTVAGITG